MTFKRFTYCVISLALCLCSSFVELSARDFDRYPAIVKLTDVKRVIATGDIHGALPQLQETLLAAGLIKKKAGSCKWHGGSSVWISLGDYVDRGDYSREVIEFIMEMSTQARKAGGRVIPLMGNHEVMLLNGDVQRRAERETRRKSKARLYGKTVDSFTRSGESFALVVSSRHPIGQFLRNLPVMAVINNRVGFVHGGFGELTTLKEVEEKFRKCLATEDWFSPFLSPRTEEAAQASPIWARHWWQNKAYVGRLLKALELRELAFAHTPNGMVPRHLKDRHSKIRSYLKTSYAKMGKRRVKLYEKRLKSIEKEIHRLGSVIQTDGRLFNLDIGMCPWYEMSKGGCLEIVDHDGSATFRAIYPDKESKLLKADPFEAKVIEGMEESLR